MQDKIGAHHPRNGAAGADGGNIGVDVQQQVGQARGHPADKIKNQVAAMAQPVFHIVAEDV